jgi:ligand-binding sensor domain-containing protein/serine phosphatase RsbU (regulator of sigma subunit)
LAVKFRNLALNMRLLPLLLLFCCNLAFPQFARFRHITANDGLAQNAVGCAIQDTRGFIWMGTFDGLHRYDGINLVTYRAETDDTTKLYSNAVKCLYADPDGSVWGGTIEGGMFRIDPATGYTSKYFYDSTKTNWISSNSIYAIKEFEKGKLYIATNDGLNIYDKASGKFTVVRKMGKNNIPFLSDNIRGIVKDVNGHLWFCHLNAGITEYDQKTGKCSYYSAGAQDENKRLNSNNIRTVFADSKGFVWISCWNSGTNVYDVKNGKMYNSTTKIGPVKNLDKASLVSGFCEDRYHNIWFATAEHGLGRFDGSDYSFSGYLEHNKDDAETISDNTVFGIFEDHSGLIWAGTWKGGMNILNPKTLNFGHYKHESNNPKSLHNNVVNCFARRSENEIYLGTAGGVGIFNTETKEFSTLPIDESQPGSLRHNSIVNSIFTASDSTIWVSTQGGFPYRYFPKKNKYENYINRGDSNSFSYHTSTTILEDKKGRIWIATSGGGLNLYNSDKNNFSWILSDQDDGTTLSSNNLSYMLLDKSGKIWIGTFDNNLNLFDPDTRKAKQFSVDRNGKPLFPDPLISALFIDSKDRFWIGTTNGLCRFYPEADSSTFIKHAKVFTSIIYGIAEDKSGNLWLSSSNGLIFFDPETKDYRVYSTIHGLQGREFSLGAVHQNKNGQLFFGGVNGFNAFFPEKASINTTAPKVILTGFSVLNKPRSLKEDITSIKEIVLDYKDYFFSVDFAALDFTDPSKNNYEYKLEGFNDNWVNIGNKPSVTFTNLDPGEYTLLLRAANNDGVWNKTPTPVKIIITPPFWRTKWFYTLCVIFILLVIYLFIKWREKKLRHEKSLLERKVTERTAELNIEKQKVEIAHKDIKDSINYAKKIQEAILPEEDEIKKHLNEYFILYKPKDIVAGDFYWFHAVSSEFGVQSSEIKNKNVQATSTQLRTPNSQLLIAAADCTGHGVPGAFMSMIGSTFLNEIVRKGIVMPDKILNELNINVRRALKQNTESSQSRDGMDIALCLVDFEKQKLYYAGANRPCLIVRNNDVLEYKADKFPVGGLHLGAENKFTLNAIDLLKGDVVYLFSDGYADQFGGSKGKKFMHKNLKELLVSSSHFKMDEQKSKLDETISAWRGRSEQVDDILVIGLRI